MAKNIKPTNTEPRASGANRRMYYNYSYHNNLHTYRKILEQRPIKFIFKLIMLIKTCQSEQKSSTQITIKHF